MHDIDNNDYLEWNMWIDIEGFSDIYRMSEATAIKALSGLASDLLIIGSKIYKERENRIFVYGIGDAFLVKSFEGDNTLERPISLGIALMRSCIIRGSAIKIGISSGNLADIDDCIIKNYPYKDIPGHYEIGHGNMYIYPVMGIGLINAKKLCDNAHGPLLLVDNNIKGFMRENYFKISAFKEHYEIDWIHSNSQESSMILSKIQPDSKPEVSLLGKRLLDYLGKYPNLSDEWVKSARYLLGGYDK
jgi:hypothetical protein